MYTVGQIFKAQCVDLAVRLLLMLMGVTRLNPCTTLWQFRVVLSKERTLFWADETAGNENPSECIILKVVTVRNLITSYTCVLVLCDNTFWHHASFSCIYVCHIQGESLVTPQFIQISRNCVADRVDCIR